jgi:hypothetical protein
LLTFASIVTIMLVTPVPGFNGERTNTEIYTPADFNSESGSLDPSQAITSHPLPSNVDLNITAAVNRTITIERTSYVSLLDQITLSIESNETALYFLNYTLPTKFTQHVVKEKFYIKYGVSPIDLEITNNSRSFTKFVGQDATTYRIDVRNGSLPIYQANTSSMIMTFRMTAINIIDFSLRETQLVSEQRGQFITPVSIFFNNVKTNGVTNVVFQTDHDQFSPQSTGPVQHTVSRLTYPNLLSEKGYDPDIGMQEDVDYATAIFDSTTPEEAPNVVIPFKYKNLQRTIQIDPFGKIYVTETITVTHDGAGRSTINPASKRSYGIGGAIVSTHSSAVYTDVYDSQGSLNLAARNETTGYPFTRTTLDQGFRALEVVFRNVVYGGEDYTFTVKYHFITEEFISTKSIDGQNQLEFNTTLFSRFNATVDNMETTIKLPEFARFMSQNYEGQTNKGVVEFSVGRSRNTYSLFQHIEIHIKGTNITEFDNLGFQLMFRYNQANLGMPVLNYFIIFLSIFAAYVAFRTYVVLPRSVKVKKRGVSDERIPVKELENFYTLYNEYLSASMRIEDIREKRLKKKLTQQDYELQLTSIKKRVKELNTKLDLAIQDTDKLQQKYKAIVQKIMLADNRVNNIRENIRKNNRSYRNKEINKEIYLRMNSDLRDEIQKNNTQIQRHLTEIAELIN